MRREVLLFCLAAVTRLGYLFAVRWPIESEYWTLAGSLARTGRLAIDGVPVADFEPLYPMVLAVARLATGDSGLAAQILQIVVASMGAVFLYRLAFKLSGVERVGTICALLFALHPLLIRQAAMPSDLSQATALLIAFAHAFATIGSLAGAAAAGFWLGLAILTRSMVLPLLACGAAILVFRRERAFALTFVLAAVVLVAPLVLRNYRVSESMWPTRSGMSLFIGNSPYTAFLLPDDDVDLLQETAEELFVQTRPDVGLSSAHYNAAFDHFLTRRALAYMIEDPLRTAREKILNVGYFLSPRLSPLYVIDSGTRAIVDPVGETAVVQGRRSRPRREVIGHAVASSFVLCTALAGVFIRRRDLGRDAILWCVVGTFVAVHALYFPATRYTAPMLFVLLFYSSVALDRAVSLASAGTLPVRPTSGAGSNGRTVAG